MFSIFWTRGQSPASKRFSSKILISKKCSLIPFTRASPHPSPGKEKGRRIIHQNEAYENRISAFSCSRCFSIRRWRCARILNTLFTPLQFLCFFLCLPPKERSSFQSRFSVWWNPGSGGGVSMMAGPKKEWGKREKRGRGKKRRTQFSFSPFTLFPLNDFVNGKYIALNVFDGALNFPGDPFFDDSRRMHRLILEAPGIGFRSKHHPPNNSNVFVPGLQII